MRRFLKPYLISLVVIGLVALLLGTYCRSLDIHVTFFRAESGTYLQKAFAPKVDQWNFIGDNMLRSYNGHFVPIAFMAEFIQTKFFRTNESLWFWRQIISLSMLGAACMLLAFRIAKKTMPIRWAAVSSIGGCFFLFQPFVMEMLTWPFMVMQFFALTLIALSAAVLTRYIDNPQTQGFALFVLLGYAVMHFSGVGAAISSAALLVGSILLKELHDARVITKNEAKTGVISLVVVAVMTSIHGILMVKDAATPAPAGEPLSFAEHAIRFFSLLIDSIYAGARAAWSNGGFVLPRVDILHVEAGYGLGVFVAIVLVLFALLSQYRKTKNNEFLLGFAIIAYPFVALVIYTALIVFRMRAVAPDDALFPYLIGGRYIIFPSFFLFMMAGAVWIVIFRVLGRLSFSMPIIFMLSAAGGTAVFVITETPRIWPHTQPNHEAEWKAIVQGVREDIAAGKPTENRKLLKLDPEFQSDLRSKRYLLERELDCTNCVNILP